MTEVVRELEIRWRDMDGFAHVNHAVYLSYLEHARDALIEELVPSALDAFVVRRVEIDYLDSLTQADGRAVVRARLAGVGTSSVRTEETIHAADGRLSAEARAVLVHTDAARTRKEPIPTALRALLESRLSAP